jgi:hypothetical protein
MTAQHSRRAAVAARRSVATTVSSETHGRPQSSQRLRSTFCTLQRTPKSAHTIESTTALWTNRVAMLGRASHQAPSQLKPTCHFSTVGSRVSSIPTYAPARSRLRQRWRVSASQRARIVSRDASGAMLYRTHHFAREEILQLLAASGFDAIDVNERIEASSRRPDQRARFFL